MRHPGTTTKRYDLCGRDSSLLPGGGAATASVRSILTAALRFLLRFYRWWGASPYDEPHADGPFRVPPKAPGYGDGPNGHSPRRQANIEANKHRVQDYRNGWFR